MRYQKHIFICANQKAEGKVCCGEVRGMELVENFRKAIQENGMQGKIRAQRAGCLDACKEGPAVVVYPEGTYYGGVTPEDVPLILQAHLNGTEYAPKLLEEKSE